MDSLEYLCNVTNGKRRRWFNVSAKAAALFRKWVQDWHKATTLEEVLDQYEMGHVLEDKVRAVVSCVGKSVQVGVAKPRAPWADGDNGPYHLNDELVYLVLLLVTTPQCERLRQCAECGVWFVAPRRSQKCCIGECSRRAASRLTAAKHYSTMRNARIVACRTAYARYQGLNAKPRKPVAEYVLAEANRHLHPEYKMGGANARVNFITRNAEAIGIPRSSLESRSTSAGVRIA